MTPADRSFREWLGRTLPVHRQRHQDWNYDNIQAMGKFWRAYWSAVCSHDVSRETAATRWVVGVREHYAQEHAATVWASGTRLAAIRTLHQLAKRIVAGACQDARVCVIAPRAMDAWHGPAERITGVLDEYPSDQLKEELPAGCEQLSIFGPSPTAKEH